MIFKATTLVALAAFTSSPICGQEWVYTLADATAKAGEKDELILAYFWADGSEYCAKLYQETLSAEDALPAMENFVCFSAKHGEEGMQDLFERLAVNTLPTLVFLDSTGEPEDLIQGYIPVEEFLGELGRIVRGEGTLSGMRGAITKARKNSEDDMSMRMSLAGKLIELGEEQAHDEILESIRKDDSRGRTLTGSRLLLADIEQQIAEEGGGEEYAANWNLEPLYAHAKAVRLVEGRFEAWNRIANLEVYKQRMPAAFEAFQTAWRIVPQERALDWSGQVANWIIQNSDQRTSLEKKFALDLATAGNKLVKKYLDDMEGEPGDEQDGFLAGSLNTLAWAYHINGDSPKAISAAKRCVKLVDSEKYRADLETFTQGHE